MKRIEMVAAIQNEFKLETLAAADSFLARIEQLGMAPPEYIAHPDSYNRSEGDYGFRVHEWEDE
jgi:hypothetical protein